MKNIINDIKNNSIKPLYLLTGEEIYLMEHYLHELTNAVTGGEADDFNSMVVSREHTDEMSIYSFVESYPFMCDRKVLIIRNTGILKKATEEEKKYFPKLLESIPDYCVIIFYEPELDKRSAIYKAICKYGYVAEFPLQKGVALTNWVAKALKSYGYDKHKNRTGKARELQKRKPRHNKVRHRHTGEQIHREQGL